MTLLDATGTPVGNATSSMTPTPRSGGTRSSCVSRRLYQFVLSPEADKFAVYQLACQEAPSASEATKRKWLKILFPTLLAG
jgi:hypothetical protein